MPLSMYQSSIPVFVRTLGNFSAILGKAAAHAEARKIDPSVLINAILRHNGLEIGKTDYLGGF